MNWVLKQQCMQINNGISWRNTFLVNPPPQCLYYRDQLNVVNACFLRSMSLSDRLSDSLHFSLKASMLSLLDAPPVRARSIEVLGPVDPSPPSLSVNWPQRHRAHLLGKAPLFSQGSEGNENLISETIKAA